MLHARHSHAELTMLGIQMPMRPLTCTLCHETHVVGSTCALHAWHGMAWHAIMHTNAEAPVPPLPCTHKPSYAVLGDTTSCSMVQNVYLQERGSCQGGILRG